jgi:hypothetical protein
MSFFELESGCEEARRGAIRDGAMYRVFTFELAEWWLRRRFAMG